MFDDSKEGLSSPLKYAVCETYEKFSKEWELHSDKLFWVELWALQLSTFTVEEINAVADYCVLEFRRSPSLGEFIQLLSRIRAGNPLNDPIVSKVEQLAYLLLTSEELAGSDLSLSEISDACLIAAAISYSKEYAKGMLDINSEYLKLEFSGRANIFLAEAQNWKEDAIDKKGYWQGIFK